MKQLTKEQAIELGNSKWYRYVNTLSSTLGRNVYTHELAEPELLIREMNREIKTPSVDEIIAMLPYDKTAVIKRS